MRAWRPTRALVARVASPVKNLPLPALPVRGYLSLSLPASSSSEILPTADTEHGAGIPEQPVSDEQQPQQQHQPFQRQRQQKQTNSRYRRDTPGEQPSFAERNNELSAEEQAVDVLSERIFLDSAAATKDRVNQVSKLNDVLAYYKEEVVPAVRVTRGRSYVRAMRACFHLCHALAESAADLDHGLTADALEANVQELMDIAISLRFWPSTKRMNILIGSLAPLSAGAAVHVYQAMQPLGVAPDIVTFNSLIKAFMFSGRFDAAQIVLADMEALGVAPDKITFNTLLRTALGQPEPAKESRLLIEKMLESGVKPDNYTLNAMLSAYAAVGDMDGAKSVVKEFNDKYDITPDVASYTTLLQSLVNRADYEAADFILDQMLEQGTRPDSHAIGVMVQVYAHRGDIDKILALIRDLAERSGVAAVAFHRCLSALQDAGRLELSLKLFRELVESGALKPDQRLCTLIVRTLSRIAAGRAEPDSDVPSPDKDDAGANEQKLGPNELLEALSSLLALMEANYIFPNQYFQDTMLTFYINLGHLNAAQKLFNDASKSKSVRRFPSPLSYVELVRGYSIAGDVEGVGKTLAAYRTFKSSPYGANYVEEVSKIWGAGQESPKEDSFANVDKVASRNAVKFTRGTANGVADALQILDDIAEDITIDQKLVDHLARVSRTRASLHARNYDSQIRRSPPTRTSKRSSGRSRNFQNKDATRGRPHQHRREE